MTIIGARLQAVHDRIAAAAAAVGRTPQGIGLVAVSKTFSPDLVREAYSAGQRAFGENYLQEAAAKMDALRDLDLEWHFIGPIQSNKTRPVAERFDWAHCVDRLKIAQRLSEARPANLPPLQVCVQVNVSGEASKSGVAPEQAPARAAQIALLPGLRLRGLMTVPEPTPDRELQRARFRALRALKERIAADGIPLDTLSMGMTDDLEAAIAEGATLVRVGRAIFGERAARR